MRRLVERLTSLKAIVGAGVACIAATFAVMTYLSTTYANRADTDRKIDAINSAVKVHTKHEDVEALKIEIALVDEQLTLVKLRTQRRALVGDLRRLDRNGQCAEGKQLITCDRLRDDIRDIDDELDVLFRNLPRPKTRGLRRR